MPIAFSVDGRLTALESAPVAATAAGLESVVGPSTTDQVQWVEIGQGHPLTVTLETVFVGYYPDTMRWIPGDQRGDVLITSAHKSFQTFGAAPRAIHLLEPNVDRSSFLSATANRPGSQLVYYSPAVADSSLLFTFEMTVDRDVDDKIGTSLSRAFAAAGALPVFAPAAPFLLAASQAVPIAKAGIDLLARPRTFFEATAEIKFDRPGHSRTVEGAALLYPEGAKDEFAGYHIDVTDYRLRNADDREYVGQTPYIIVSLDGRERSEYRDWAAEAASAAMLDRFFGHGSGAGAAGIDEITKALSLYNDVRYQQQGVDAKKRANDTSLGEDERARQRSLLETYKKNISNEDLRRTLDD